MRVYDPKRAWNGYTLALFRQRVPTLIDMNGRVVHAWPGARVKSRVRLLRDGSLLGIALGRAVVEYDWSGNVVWEYRLQGGFPHHDVVRLNNGNTMLVMRPDRSRTDDLLEVDRHGEVVWRWPSGDYLQAHIDDRAALRGDITHVNSVQEIPPNPWFRLGDVRFRPGNLLISARNLDAVFIIDKQTKAVVWSFAHDLDLQHEALMVESGLPGQGNILLFNNRYGSFYGDRQSTILEVLPPAGTVIWEYRSHGFYTPIGGIEQPLPNGNLLISSTRGGRVFEITRTGRTVWEWVPPFDPVREQRYAFDHCPQLAALGQPAAAPVLPPADYRHIDKEAYRFARRGSRREILIKGRQRSVLKSNRDCRRVVLPAAATLQVEYGLDGEALERAGRSSYAARFTLRLQPERASEEITLLESLVELSTASSRSETVPLFQYAHQRVGLCMHTEEVGSPSDRPTEEFAYWVQPSIQPAPDDDASAGDREATHPQLTAEELVVRNRHFEALGYVE